jgi:hypothetical protein
MDLEPGDALVARKALCDRVVPIGTQRLKLALFHHTDQAACGFANATEGPDFATTHAFSVNGSRSMDRAQ